MDPGNVQDRREQYYNHEDDEPVAKQSEDADYSHEGHHDEPDDLRKSGLHEEVGDLEDQQGRGYGGDGHQNRGRELPQRTDHELLDIIDGLGALTEAVQSRAGFPRDDGDE